MLAVGPQSLQAGIRTRLPTSPATASADLARPRPPRTGRAAARTLQSARLPVTKRGVQRRADLDAQVAETGSRREDLETHVGTPGEAAGEEPRP